MAFKYIFPFQRVQDHYASKKAEPGQIEQSLTFSGDSITLDVPTKGIETENGWQVAPVAFPTVNSY